MKKINLKDTNGITLITLVITIIVLAILAGVTVTALTGEKSVIKEANDAKSSSEQESAKEKVQAAVLGATKKDGSIDIDILNRKLGSNIESLPAIVTMNGIKITISEDGSAGGWIETAEGITNGNITVQIGDYVNYNESSNGIKSISIDYTKNGGTSSSNNQNLSTEDLGWRVLGINSSSQLELISDNATTSTVYLRGEQGYLNAENILNNTSNELYGKGTYAAGARSLNAEDVNKLAKYNPDTFESNGKKYIYRFSSASSYLQYSKDGGITWKDITEARNQTFRLPGEEETISSSNYGKKEVRTKYYSYSISTEIQDENIANMILKGTGSSSKNQWLATCSILAEGEVTGPGFSVFRIYAGYVYGTYMNYAYYTNGTENNAGTYYIRPVVTLNSNIQLTGSSTEGWNIIQ